MGSSQLTDHTCISCIRQVDSLLLHQLGRPQGPVTEQQRYFSPLPSPHVHLSKLINSRHLLDTLPQPHLQSYHSIFPLMLVFHSHRGIFSPHFWYFWMSLNEFVFNSLWRERRQRNSCFQTNGSALRETRNCCEHTMQEHFSYVEKTSAELAEKRWIQEWR